MVATPEPDETRLAAVTAAPVHTRRRGREVLAEAVFRPLASLVVRALAPLRVSPVAVVLANTLAGLAAAAALARGQLVGAALLLQLKTVLDNADGRLARETGRTTALGRYLDTEADLLVNVALFAALAHETGSPLLALLALLTLTFVLSADFNEDVLHRRARGELLVTEPSAAGEGAVARALGRVYRVVFAPQDDLLQGLARRRLDRVLSGVADPDARSRVTLAYFDGVTATVLANFGLSTQLAVLGVCLALGAPAVYLWIVVGCAAALPVLQLRRELVARRVLQR
jgi:phosphatidylglycerophosphate synthase